MSTEDPARLSTLALVLRRRWRLLVTLSVVGALLGVVASLLFSPGYVTSTSVLLQGPREPDELLTEAQVAMSSVVLDRAALALGWGATGADLQDSVTAEVADGNVIKISASADTAEKAHQLADQVAQEYVQFSTQLISNTADASAQMMREQKDALREQIRVTNEKISALHESIPQAPTVESVQTRTNLEGLRTALQQAVTKLEEADAATAQANMVVMGPAERPSGPAAPTMPHLVLGGAVLLFVIGLFGHLFAARADRRLRDDPQIAAALGAPVLGTLDVTDYAGEPQRPEGRFAWFERARRFVLEDPHWNDPELAVADDAGSREIRLRRVLTRLPGDSARSRRVLVVVADDDRIGLRAAEQLAETARKQGLARLEVVPVAAARPTVPEDRGAAGVLVVLTAGTRTGWELVAIAGACADAGHDEVAAIVTYRTRPDRERPEPANSDRPGEDAAGRAPAGTAMAGSP